jgi:hypothetical protein
MNNLRLAGALLASALLVAGCAKGTESGPTKLSNGEYELSTIALEGNCALQDALSPGTEYVGKVARVMTKATTNSVQIEPCDPFFEDCFTTLDGDISLMRIEDELLADDPNWAVPACTCFEAYTATRSGTGTIVAEDRVELTWTFEVTTPPPESCMCQGAPWQACQATLSQILSRP